MGRRRQHDLDLPPLMTRRDGRYYYGRNHVALGPDFAAALRRYAELHTGDRTPGTFAEAIAEYEKRELPQKAPKTQAEYRRQIAVLRGVFGKVRLDQLRPAHVAGYLAERAVKVETKGGKVVGGPIVATREKALLSAIFTFARVHGLTDAPNPCSGIRGTKSHRERAVTDEELGGAIVRAATLGDATLAGYLELLYRTGQRPSDVARMRRQDIRDGVLSCRQAKTGALVRIEVVGPLAELVERLNAGTVASVFLVHDDRGQRLTLGALRKRFDRLGCDWTFMDLRAKAATDTAEALSNRAAQKLLGHAAATTTDGYIRQRAGERATPVMRKITGSSPRFAGADPRGKSGADA